MEAEAMKANEKPSTKEKLPSTNYRGWKAMPYIIGNETFEKLGTIGTSSNLLVYLTTIFHMKSVGATTVVNVFNGTANLAPIFGAFLSDVYFGRYIILGFASVSSFVGMFILTLTATITTLHPPSCSSAQHCAGPTAWQLITLLSAFAFMSVGAGGIRPCNLAFGADQFDPNTESGRKGINSFFNWYYFTFTFSMMLSATVIIYVQSDVSWPLGLAIPTILMFFSCVVFFVGTRMYVRVKPEGSPFVSVAQVMIAAFWKRRFEYTDVGVIKHSFFDPPHVSALISKLPHTDQFRFLDKASITLPDDINQNGAAKNPWRLCTLQQVEEVKCLFRIIPVWSAGLMFNISAVQQSNYSVFQALQSDRHLVQGSSFEIPAGSFIVFVMLSLTVWLPIYDRVVTPKLRRLTGKEEGITMLQRMGIGLVLCVLCMVTSAVVEERRRSYALNRPTIGTASGGGEISSMSSLWLIPQLALIGLAEAFNAIGQIEFYYKQFPENMRSIAGSLFFFSLAASNYISSLMVTVVHRITGREGKVSWLAQDLNEGRLDYFYFLIAALGALNFIYFMVCASWYRYKKRVSEPEVAMVMNNAKSLA